VYPIPGHLSLSILGNRYCKAAWVPVIIGGFLPDLIDKPLDDILHWTPYGRCMMHSLVGLCLAVGIAYLIWGRNTAYSYMVSHIGHLLGDADFNPWFWPLHQYTYPPGITILDLWRAPGTIFFPTWFLVETVILGLAVFLYTRYARKQSVQAAILATIFILSVYRITRKRPMGLPEAAY